MRFKLKHQILAVCFILILLSILATSGVYYALMIRDIRELSRTQIASAFEMFFDGLHAHVMRSLPQLDVFVTDSLTSPLHFLQRSLGKYANVTQEQHLESWDQADTQTWMYIQDYLKRLKNIAESVQEFIPLLNVQEFAIYDHDRNILVLYQQNSGHDTLGIYLHQFRQGLFISLLNDEYAEAIVKLQGIREIPQQALPPGISAVYPQDAPTTPQANLSAVNDQVTVKFIIPVYRDDVLKGLCVVHIGIPQDDVEHYARFSKTLINLFAGTRLSFGTLADYTTMTYDESEPSHTVDMLPFEGVPTVAVSTVTIGGQLYYQGKFLFEDPPTGGAITANFARQMEVDKSKELLLLVGLVTLVVGAVTVFVAFGLTHKILDPIHQLEASSEAIGQGNLNVRIAVTRHDEIGHLSKTFHAMLMNLKTLIRQVQRSGIQVTSSATELSVTAKQQEVTMTSQIDFANTVVTSMRDISDVAVHLTATMQRVAAMSQEATEYANNGQADLFHMEEAMRNMEEASTSISNRLRTISEKADKITTVVTTINKVAEQTNLLSLNASIEAEKAGEYGRGFTVVAREIRRLADQTAVSTLNIGIMVQEMQTAVSSGIMEMDKFIAQVRHSAEDVGKISMQLTLIIDQVQALSPNFDEVTRAVEQQSNNAQSIDGAMRRLREDMEQTKESLRETHTIILQLNEAARNLRNEVSRFNVD